MNADFDIQSKYIIVHGFQLITRVAQYRGLVEVGH